MSRLTGLLAVLLASSAVACPMGEMTVLSWPPPPSQRSKGSLWVPPLISPNNSWALLESGLKARSIGCVPCPQGAVTVKAPNGMNFCVGGIRHPKIFYCPGGGSFPTTSPFQSWKCYPCPAGFRSFWLNDLSVCMPDSCPQDRVPLPVMGPRMRYECLRPLEAPEKINWTAVRGESAAQYPKCSSGEGVVYTDPDYAKPTAYRCEPCPCKNCSADSQLLPFRGVPVCTRLPVEADCPGQGIVQNPFGGAALACAPCPKGTKPEKVLEYYYPVCRESSSKL